MGSINVGLNSRPAHAKFVAWINGLLVSYTPGFWDPFISNMMQLGFIDTHYCSMFEMYKQNGAESDGFIVAGSLNTPNPMLIYFDEVGVPLYYNNTFVGNLFTFDGLGKVSAFFENVEIDMFNAAGVQTKKLRITFRKKYGINNAMLQLINAAQKTDNEGIIDVLFPLRQSGAYAVELKPLEDLSKFLVTNLTHSILMMDIPILDNLTIPYTLLGNGTIEVPVTAWSEYYLREAQDLGSISFKII